jgi:hypothetical protein
MSTESQDALGERLTMPFELEELKYKPQAVKGDRALAVFFIDSRVVMDRLDEVFGVDGWMDEYTPLGDGSVMCKLSVWVADKWISKTDVGSPSEQPDSGDRTKAAFSDALKRVAVKFGIGRYLYKLPLVWLGYDPQKRKFTEVPKMPSWAMPPAKTHVAQSQLANKQPAPAQLPQAIQPPQNGEELLARLKQYESKLVETGAIRAGELVTHLVGAGVRAGYGENITKWSGPAIPFASQVVIKFTENLKAKQLKSVDELWQMQTSAPPKNGLDLCERLDAIETELLRLVHNYERGDLTKSVRQFANVNNITQLASLQGQQMLAAWNRAMQFLSACAKGTTRGSH